MHQTVRHALSGWSTSLVCVGRCTQLRPRDGVCAVTHRGRCPGGVAKTAPRNANMTKIHGHLILTRSTRSLSGASLRVTGIDVGGQHISQIRTNLRTTIFFPLSFRRLCGRGYMILLRPSAGGTSDCSCSFPAWRSMAVLRVVIHQIAEHKVITANSSSLHS